MYSVPPYSLPSTSEISLEDDWAEIKDPKEKKRIQNRIAQRSYRERMKARLGKLQAKVDFHERTRMRDGEKDNDAPRDRIPEALHVNQAQPPTAETEFLASKTPEIPQVPQSHMLQPNFYEQAMDIGDNPMSLQNSQYMHNSPSQQPLPQSHSQLLEWNPKDMKAPKRLFMDYMHSPKQTQDKRSNQQEGTNFLNMESQASNTTKVLLATSRPEQSNQTHKSTPLNNKNMDFTVNVPLDIWKSDVLSQTRRQTSSPSLQDSIGPPTVFSDTNGAVAESDSTATDMQDSPKTSPDESFEWILECAQDSGFDSFDAMVTSYYNTSFGESSPLSNEQRLSRNRRLPKVIADIFHAAGKWSDWERRGFHEEILKTTETMLISEGNTARNSLRAGIVSLTEAQKFNTSTTGQTFLAMKKMTQNELPNLWALMMALASDTRAVWQRDNSNTVFASILLLRCADRIPNEQLLQLLGMCL